MIVSGGPFPDHPPQEQQRDDSPQRRNAQDRGKQESENGEGQKDGPEIPDGHGLKEDYDRRELQTKQSAGHCLRSARSE